MDQWAVLDRGERRRMEMWAEASSQSRSPLHVRVTGLPRGSYTDATLLAPGILPAIVRPERGALTGMRALSLEESLLGEFFADGMVGTHGGVETVVMGHPEARLQPSG
jgi:hypothetical protein